MRAIGDLATHLLSSQFQSRLRQSADTSAQEATTGLAKDKVRHLGGATMTYSLLDRKTKLLQEHKRGIAEVAVFASATQSVLGKIQDQTTELSNRLSFVSQLENKTELKTLSESAQQSFVDVVHALNTEIAGRHLFSGTATDRRPLPNGVELLERLQTDLSGATTPQDVLSAISDWFGTSTGAFETGVYAGSVSGFSQRSIGPGASVTFGLRADDDSVRELLAALATAAIASNETFGFSATEQQVLLDKARNDLLKADRNLIEERAGVGLIESAIETARIETDAEIGRLELDRVSLLGIDQFQAASDFEAAQQQLDVFYRIAARQSRVSLAEYLR